MFGKRMNWALSTLVVCAGLWCITSPSSTDAASGEKVLQVTLVGVEGKALAATDVEFVRLGGKPYEAIQVAKGTWVIKNADDKVTVNVRNGRIVGSVELAVPADADEVSYNVILSGSDVRAERAGGSSTPSSTKVDMNSSGSLRSTRSNFSAQERPNPLKGQNPAGTNSSTKHVEFAAPPVNDLCADAISVSVPSVTSGTTVEATLDGVGTCGTTNTAPGVWYTFVGNGTVVTVDTCANTPYDSKISVFTGACGSLTCVGGNDDTTGCGTSDARVSFCATMGVTYRVLVHGFSSGTGTFDLTVSSGASCAPPANDLCDNAVPMGPLPDSETVDVSFATNDVLPEPCGSAPQNKTVWYSVVGDGSTYTATTCNTNGTLGDTEVVVYCNDCALSTCVGGDDDACALSGHGLKSIFTWCTEPGATYLIAAGAFSASGVGTIQLDVTSDGVPGCAGAVSCLVAPTGACCEAGTCTGTTEEADCAGTWHEGESCPAYACPVGGCPDTCGSAAAISSLPFNATGDTCTCSDDYDSVCPYTGSTSGDAVYSYTPSSDTCVSVSLCNGSNYDTKVYVFDNDCTTAAIACNDDQCTSPNFPSPYVSSLSSVSLTAGHTYYFVVDGYAGECGNYVLDIAEIPCPPPCGVCPPGGIAENEPDCDSVNGGCNSAPPVFSPVACGQTVCGTASWDGTTRDTDWYQVTFAADTEFTWTVQAEFGAVIGMVETSPLGTPDCATATALDPFAVTVDCGVGSVTRCVPPGTYWFFVAPDFNGPTFTCGETYTASLECIGCTPPTCTGDTCETAEVIPSTPYSTTGDSCICNDNYDEICPFVAAGSPDKVYVYTPAVDECVDISMCAGSAYDTKVYVYQGSCGTYQSGSQIACNDDFCTSPNFGAPYVSSITNLNLTGGETYYIVVDGYAGDCGNYTLDIGPCCNLTCSPGSTPENEANCGIPEDTTNGGCNSAPPVFSPMACGQSYCGTAAFDGGLRDTDWFEVTVASSTRFTWTANSEFPSLTGHVPTAPAGSGDCADVVGVVDPAIFGNPCSVASATTDCLPAGTYWFFMAPTFAGIIDCGAEYEVNLSCEPCVIPLGACCRPDGSCDDGIAEVACENWQGEGTVCTGPGAVSCPQPPANDLCDDAITVAIPSTTAGDTSLATFDTGLPATCGTSITTAGVWYKVIGNGNTLTADTCNGATTYDSKISVFCPNCSAPACVGGNDDACGPTGFQSSVSWCSAPGETYLILVHGFGGSTGPFELVISDGPACSNPPSCVVAPICGGGGDCCVANPGVPGCNDAACCDQVCGCDPYCCDVEWDINCAGPNAFVPGCSALELGCCGGGGNTGACCRGSACTIETQADCIATGNGNYLGDGTNCGSDAGNPTVVSANVGMSIEDGTGVFLEHTINVPAGGNVGDLNIDLAVTHTWVGDLIVEVEHLGTTVILVDRPGTTTGGFGCGEDNYDIVLNDEGQGGAIESQCVPSLSSPPDYTPNNPLAAFDGMAVGGNWTIRVSDNADFDEGTLDRWSLHFGQPGAGPCVETGACCLDPDTCVVVEPANCTGQYLGANTNCDAAGPVTVYAADPAMAIPDAPASPPGAVGAPISHTISVPDSYTVAGVDIDLILTHTWVGDLIVSVEHGGTTVVLVDRPGFAGTGFGCGSDNYNIILDDQGSGGTVEDLCGASTTPPSPPNYTPNNPLSAFNGMNSAGNWTITVNDNANLDTGTLDHWSVHLTAPGSGPCSGIDFCGNGTVEGDEQCDGGACCNPDCTFASAGTSCRPAAGDCDVAETCSGSSSACPPDGFAGSSVVCRPSTGACDPQEVCSGNGPNCPPNGTITSCVGGDGCCPSGCNNVTDPDCAPICGNNVTESGEECDGLSAEACDATCLPDCTCELTSIPTMSEWGLAVLALCLLIGAKLYFGRREAVA